MGQGGIDDSVSVTRAGEHACSGENGVERKVGMRRFEAADE